MTTPKHLVLSFVFPCLKVEIKNKKQKQNKKSATKEFFGLTCHPFCYIILNAA